ncbi:MAG: hypothetical protein OEZ36_07940 [Spirochaetota bacterium]|nr:hypothetical protein [Spirochaetota bacterium]
MAFDEGDSLSQPELMDYMPCVFESVTLELGLRAPYEIIYQIAKDLNSAYSEISLDLENPQSIVTLFNQVKAQKLEFPIRKFFETVRSNFGFNKLDYPQFRRIILQQMVNFNKLDKENAKERMDLFKSISDYEFGNIRKILKSRDFPVKEEAMLKLYPQVLEGYERVLMWINEKHPDETDAEKVKWYSQIHFPENEEELIAIYEKNRSLTESVFSVTKLENIAILTRVFSGGASIDIGVLIKEALVNWRNEISEITRTAKEERRIQKEDAKRKKIDTTEEEVEMLYDLLIPGLLEGKNLKEILVDKKDILVTPQAKKIFASLLQQLNPVEDEFVDILKMEKPMKLFKGFDKNEFEGRAICYFGLLYKAYLDGNIDFLLDLIKQQKENYLLRLSCRKLFFLKIQDNSKIKNPVGENKVFGAFLSSFERIIMNEEEPLENRRDNLVQFSKLIISGFPDLSESFNTMLNDLFIKLYSELLDVNLLNKYASLKKMSEKENVEMEMMKDAFKLYEAITRELANPANKTRDQMRRNEFLLTKIERKLAANVKKIRTKTVSL